MHRQTQNRQQYTCELRRRARSRAGDFCWLNGFPSIVGICFFSLRFSLLFARGTLQRKKIENHSTFSKYLHNFLCPAHWFQHRNTFTSNGRQSNGCNWALLIRCNFTSKPFTFEMCHYQRSVSATLRIERIVIDERQRLPLSAASNGVGGSYRFGIHKSFFLLFSAVLDFFVSIKAQKLHWLKCAESGATGASNATYFHWIFLFTLSSILSTNSLRAT